MCLPYTSLLHSYWGVFTNIKVKCRSISSAFIVKMSIIYKNYNSAQNCWDINFHVFFNFSPCNFIVETEQSRPPSHPLTNVVLARMGSESIAYEAEGRMGYWLRGHEDERNNCFSKIQLVGQKYRDKTTLASKTRFSRHCFGFQSRRFSLLVGYNI